MTAILTGRTLSASSASQQGSHFEVLDGLRGTAAFCVVLFHIAELASPDAAHNLVRHTPLAVDFFFALSGFVMAHAYDQRLSQTAPPSKRLTLRAYILRRLVRLQPMVIVGMTLGLIGFIFDPFVGPKPVIGVQVSVATLIIVYALSLLVLPAPELPNRFGETHPLNSPAWSLAQEYLANAFYGVIGYRLSKRWLAGLCVISAASLIFAARHVKTMALGWDWDDIWVAPVRLSYPFLIGLLLYRLKVRILLPFGYIILSLALIAIFTAPTLGALTSICEALCVIGVFPLILCLGSGQVPVDGVMGRFCRWTGRLSYPLYMSHYPAIYIYDHWLDQGHPSQPLIWVVSVGLYIGLIAMAWAITKYYDEPLRAYLGRKLST